MRACGPKRFCIPFKRARTGEFRRRESHSGRMAIYTAQHPSAGQHLRERSMHLHLRKMGGVRACCTRLPARRMAACPRQAWFWITLEIFTAPQTPADQPDEAAYTASETAAIRYVRHFSDELLRIEVSFALADSPGSRQSANSSAKTETCVFQRR